MNEYPLVTQLKEASDYDKVFDLVKSTVEKSISPSLIANANSQALDLSRHLSIE